MTAAEKRLEEVLALPRSERAKLVARVSESLTDEAPARPDFVSRNRELLAHLAK